jgi:uncharacterized surface protein with fasciclin (FAS1) repeats
MLRSLTARTFVGSALVVVLVAAGCGDDDGESAGDVTSASTMAEEMGDVLEVAAAEGDLGTFLGALEAAEIMDGLHEPGPFTVFVPTDEAFEDYLGDSGMTQAEVFAERQMLRGLLDYHIVNTSEMSEQVMEMAGQSFETASGQPLDVSVDGDTVMVGNATVERYDIPASNGVVHVIDAVLMPPES